MSPIARPSCPRMYSTTPRPSSPDHRDRLVELAGRSRTAATRTRRRSGTRSAPASAPAPRRPSRPGRAPRGSGRRRRSRRRRRGTRPTRWGSPPRRPGVTSTSRWRRYSIRSAIEISFRSNCSATFDELGQPRHRAVLVHHLADHARGEQPRERARGRPPPRCGRRGGARRRPWPAAGTRGRDAGSPAGVTLRVGDRAGGRGTVLGARARRDARAVVDRDREGGLVPAVRAHHLRDLQLVEPPRGHRQAHDPAAVGDHEVQRLAWCSAPRR